MVWRSASPSDTGWVTVQLRMLLRGYGVEATCDLAKVVSRVQSPVATRPVGVVVALRSLTPSARVQSPHRTLIRNPWPHLPGRRDIAFPAGSGSLALMG